MNTGPTSFLGMLVTLRWCAVAGQLATIAVVVWWLQVPLPLWPMGIAIAALALFNLQASYRIRRGGEAQPAEIFLHLAVDTVVLALLIGCSGGPANPFTSLFLLPIAFAAMALPHRWIWATALLCGLGYAGAAAFGRPLPHVHGPMDGFDLHLLGMAVNFLISAGVFVYFLSRMAEQRARRERELAQMRERFARDEGILALATHAASVAHELNTPLATMLLVLEELGHRRLPPEVVPDIELLETLTDTCRERVSELARAGQFGQGVDPEQVAARWSLLRPTIRLQRPETLAPGTRVDAAVGHLLQALLDNAADASQAAGSDQVTLALRRDEHTLCGEILDRGHGFDPERPLLPGTLFRSDKPQGMGVGLALSHATIERLGGRLTMQAGEQGSRVHFRVPLLDEETR